MTAVVQLRADVAKLLQGDGGLETQATPESEVRQDLDRELARLHMSLKPIHPGTEDQDLARYFTLTSSQGPADEEALGALRKLEAVTAAYIKPEEEPA